jgi:hypothetical protein
MVQIMYTHVSKCKNDKIKFKKELHSAKNLIHFLKLKFELQFFFHRKLSDIVRKYSIMVNQILPI